MNTESIILYTFYFFAISFILYLFKSKIIERYFLIETLKPFFICLFIITFIMMLDRLIDLMNIIIEKQLDIITIINLFALSLPFIFALSVPMAVLTSTIMAFGRMSVDQELTATKSTGINILSMTTPLILFFLMVTFGMAYFNDFILPDTNHLLKNVLIKITYKKPVTAIKPGTFTTMNNLTIYAKDRTDEALLDIIIFNTENSRFPQTIQAEKGEIFLDPSSDLLKVILYNGEMHERDQTQPDKYQISKFSQYTFMRTNLGYNIDDSGSEYRGDREMTSTQMKELINERQNSIDLIENDLQLYSKILSELNNEIDYEEFRKYTIMSNLKQSQKDEMSKQIRMYKVEIHKKYSLAVACFIFLLVGLPIGMMTKTSGVGVSFSFSSIIFIVYYVLIVFGEEIGDRGLINPSFVMWIPALIFLIIGIFLLYIAKKEKHINITSVWILIKKSITRVIFRKKHDANTR